MKFSLSRLLLLFVVFVLANPDFAFSRSKEKQRPLRPSSSTSGSDGNIRDKNYAYENGDMAKQQIEQQKGVKVLEQANELNQKPLDPIR